MKKCTDDKILNPNTNRCVSRTGKIGRELLKNSTIDKKKIQCSVDKILNPDTNRCVSRTGKIGKELLKKTSKFKSPPKKSKQINSIIEQENINKIIDHINLNTIVGKALKRDLLKTLNIDIVKAYNRKGGNRNTHYDFIVVDKDNIEYRVEHKGSSVFKRINILEKPWKSGVQFANIGAEKYCLAKEYAKIWYEQYIGNNYLKKKYNISSDIPKFEVWFKNDCCQQGNPKTMFGKELKMYCKNNNVNLLSLRTEVNKIMAKDVLTDNKIMDNFLNAVEKVANKCLESKDLWLQINGDVDNIDKVHFKWYNKFIISKIIKVNCSIKSDIDFDFICNNNFKFSAKLRWGKGCGFSNLRIDLK